MYILWLSVYLHFIINIVILSVLIPSCYHRPTFVVFVVCIVVNVVFPCWVCFLVYCECGCTVCIVSWFCDFLSSILSYSSCVLVHMHIPQNYDSHTGFAFCVFMCMLECHYTKHCVSCLSCVVHALSQMIKKDMQFSSIRLSSL